MKINSCEVSLDIFLDRFVVPVNWLFKIDKKNGGGMDGLNPVKLLKKQRGIQKAWECDGKVGESLTCKESPASVLGGEESCVLIRSGLPLARAQASWLNLPQPASERESEGKGRWGSVRPKGVYWQTSTHAPLSPRSHAENMQTCAWGQLSALLTLMHA